MQHKFSHMPTRMVLFQVMERAYHLQKIPSLLALDSSPNLTCVTARSEYLRNKMVIDVYIKAIVS